MSHQELQGKLTDLDIGVVFAEEASEFLTVTVPKETFIF